MNPTLRRRWLAALTAILAVMYATVGVAGQGSVRPAGLLGASVILASLALARRYRWLAITLLVLGVAPLVALTWWSIGTPAIAITCLILGWPRRTHSMIASNGQEPTELGTAAAARVQTDPGQGLSRVARGRLLPPLADTDVGQQHGGR
jgi:hypothetical protein